ncbi:hypothetical protein M622_15965 [Thauera terpenica 58Eu]|uniref:Flagellar hook-associated protein 2 n=1 Tax=Thauera terpenica 58Eu TaxID=1348657 RepID=T0AXX9_9RHOO|nr:flagellar filament capping protein FliD [Thauera terpenica]EPZ15428.1 hypothetical protein M622_15965 [Thauera terpenica 58Eu]
MASSLSVGGLGSGIDVSGIVSQLMEIERQPLKALDTKEASVQARISAFGSIKSSLSTLQNAIAGLKLPAGGNALDFYSTYSGTLSDDGVASVTATDGTVPGKYSLEVTQLAKENRLISAAGTSIGSGELTISLGSADGTATTRSTTVSIGDGSLSAVRDAINGANAGVTAAVINGDAGPQLVLSANEGGSKQFISLSGVSGLDYSPAAPTANFTTQQTAQSALITLNGVAIESQSNKISDALEGVTIDLKKATEADKPVTLTLARDTSSINKVLEKFVSAYNEYNTLARDLGRYDPSTDKAGALLGDSALRGADSKMRSMLSSVPAELAGLDKKTLSDIGISTQKDGSLKLDSGKLDKALAADFAGVAKVAAGYGRSMDGIITGLIGSEGVITGKTTGLQSSITSIDKQRQTLEQRLDGIEARYKAQYTALDTLVSGMLQTSTYLEQQLASLSSFNKK